MILDIASMKKGDLVIRIITRMRVYHHDKIVHIINSQELHIIKPKQMMIIHAVGVMIYKGVSAFDDIQAHCA